MTTFLFPDNTVLCNFACVDGLELLKTILDGRGRWTAAVAYEVAMSSRYITALRCIPTDGWLDEPIEITDELEIARVQRIRRAIFGGIDDQPLKHLGEAETCFVIKEWPQLAGSWWISDDRDAVRHARFRGITARETIDLIKTAVVNGDIDDQSAYDLMLKMADAGRGLRLPKSRRELQG